MHPIHADNARDSRLRLVFNDTVMSFDLAADATFGEIARTLGEQSCRRHGHAIAIDVRLKRYDGSGRLDRSE